MLEIIQFFIENEIENNQSNYSMEVMSSSVGFVAKEIGIGAIR
jgi:hypothetical protein